MPITRTPIIDDSGSGQDGTVLDNAWKQELYDQIDGIGAAQAYTPAWSGSAIGNGALSALYGRAGKLVDVRIALTVGSTTVPGSGVLYFVLPSSADFPQWMTGRAVLYRSATPAVFFLTVLPGYFVTGGANVFGLAIDGVFPTTIASAIAGSQLQNGDSLYAWARYYEP
jgi:hypothetical protein